MTRSMQDIMPRAVRDTIYSVQQNRRMNAGIEAMMGRQGEIGDDPFKAKLIGIGLMPESREHVDRRLDSLWAQTPLPPFDNDKNSPIIDEMVVGAGLHAAIYSAVRVATGHPRPLVVEQHARAGGSFACTSKPTFYLNSRNREGSLGFPGGDGALNYLPGAPVQPADLSGDEYQRNSDLAYVVRMTLAMYANVATGWEFSSMRKIYDPADSTKIVSKVTLYRGDELVRVFLVRRVVFATGLGYSRQEWKDAKHVMGFFDFMRHMEQMFPLRGLGRVAVIGAGDGGKSVIEALTGQGPTEHWSVRSLDQIDQIDWLDDRLNGQTTCQAWQAVNRTRYKAISKLLPKVDGARAVVTPVVKKAAVIADGYSSATVDDKPYDLVIDCRGFVEPLRKCPYEMGFQADKSGGRNIARVSQDTYAIGPAAQIALSSTEIPSLGNIPENSTALFRYAERTATLAAMLP